MSGDDDYDDNFLCSSTASVINPETENHYDAIPFSK